MKKIPMLVGESYTNNDGNNCESEITIKRIAEKYLGPDQYYGDTEHEEFELHIQTPKANTGKIKKENPEGGFIQKLKVSRDNLESLKTLLSGMDFSKDTPVYKHYWE